jgi:hypothetical protein
MGYLYWFGMKILKILANVLTGFQLGNQQCWHLVLKARVLQPQ